MRTCTIWEQIPPGRTVDVCVVAIVYDHGIGRPHPLKKAIKLATSAVLALRDGSYFFEDRSTLRDRHRERSHPQL